MTTWYRRRPHRTGLAVAATALALAAGAAVTSGLALARTVEPAQHTVNVVAPPPAATHDPSEVKAAKSTACAAWERSARSTASASKASAEALEQSWSSPESVEALANEKRTGMTAVSYLRTQTDSATPAATAIPLHDWMTANINMLHALNMRHWDEADREQKRGNDLVDVITSECGLR
ncbi:hypothetical protein AU184_18640 [Mycolicibacterium novocastrense]|jgi:hypothetical protein|uniref:hypothetical protein n=1 Tax=Mycobacteriaceae TaxID=1762 RepID=UPI00074B277F|nr:MULTISPECIES: hypothetical protein [Mycobacteriaceae]KUH65582.1 hypothetical protein AU184_18640 [Mycolicibacterium novocastrense]KUH77407.1 hypothetical protein AU072_22250 [Mycolicibacterium novocastrense]KUH77738.1 hypothetical protein AU183_22240 [Mycolicibacterium novocastrense]OBF90988.1 hypothetical protein A5790_15790 [Mycobacterium sp. 852002-51152_SCH6134967]